MLQGPPQRDAHLGSRSAHRLDALVNAVGILECSDSFRGAKGKPMPERFVLIAGRTARQGTTLNKSKLAGEYLEEISTVYIAPEDAERLGLRDGQRVRLSSDHGSVVLRCRRARKDELAPGVLFLPYGDASSRLMGADTHGTGMPDSKGLDVVLEPLPDTTSRG